MGFARSLVHSELALHSTHAPAPPHTGIVASLVLQAIESAFEQPTQEFAMQNDLFMSDAQWASPVHSAQRPLPVSQTAVGALQAPDPAS
jgi:hypothetical protein